MYILERKNGRLCSLDFRDVWRGGSALKIPLKGGEARKVPFNTTHALDTMDLDHLRTVQARAIHANYTITMVAAGP
jgi:hypothetical protein